MSDEIDYFGIICQREEALERVARAEAELAEQKAENERLRDLIRRCMKVGCQWCGLSAVSFEVEQRVMCQVERGKP